MFYHQAIISLEFILDTVRRKGIQGREKRAVGIHIQDAVICGDVLSSVMSDLKTIGGAKKATMSIEYILGTVRKVYMNERKGL